MHYVSSQHNYAIAAQLQHGELRNSYTCPSCCFTGLINLFFFKFCSNIAKANASDVCYAGKCFGIHSFNALASK